MKELRQMLLWHLPYYLSKCAKGEKMIMNKCATNEKMMK